MDEIREKKTENVELARKNTQPVPMDLSGMRSQDQKFQGNCSWCGIWVTWRERVERKLNTCKTIKRVNGLARTTKPKASL